MSSVASPQETSSPTSLMLQEANSALAMLAQAESSAIRHERLRHRVLAARVYDSISETLDKVTLNPEERLLVNQKLSLIKTRLYYAAA